eukprot:CAMPEP_0203662806 /NCGR_PEP_ID=MMETSP0090-20130426/637_1 /ASSEMBLY_ACC=CAM_ASM_001088 /TAXON_ID=426623 /ORGANISM="Chaetoceros affinis, Strain CCMP159" /LENGTH=1026 /DNA_ID=CAMNT_0050525641 /DNA_START=552 /DNA_END=3632 /DNA_ORIENTATION=-
MDYMDTTTVNLDTIASRGAHSPAFATPSPPESCILSNSSEHLPPPESMQPNENGHLEKQQQQQQEHRHQQHRRVTLTLTEATATPPSAPESPSAAIVTRQNPSPPSTMNSSNGGHHSADVQASSTETNSTDIGATSATKPQHMSASSERGDGHGHGHGHGHEIAHPQQKNIDHPPPPIASTVSTVGTTTFPSLPPASSTDQSNRNKRPTRDRVLRKLSDALMRRSLTMIDLSQRELRPSDATLVKLALLQNSSLSVLKLGYNNLCDDGVTTLASGISTHSALTSLDLGFNNIGDKGCIALSSAILSTSRRGGQLHTLYLAGNCIGREGARALAQVVRCGCGLKRIHLTNNSIGSHGIKELMEAVIDYEVRIPRDGPCSSYEAISIASTKALSSSTSSTQDNDTTKGNSTYANPTASTTSGSINEGLTELFLGGTNMGHVGCVAVAKMLEQTRSLRVLSLANCELNDKEATILAAAITKNSKQLPIEKLQLSFNNLTCKGIEALMNAVWGLKNLKELQLDNNQMQARGAQVVAAVLGAVKTLNTLNVGFNAITGSGIKILMKAVAESKTLTSLTISGNNIDAGSANAVAIALAHNKSLTSLFVDHCSIPSEGQRLMTAGIVSNSNTRLQILTGFRIGAYAKILRLPEALERCTNEQVLSFILLMWRQMRQEQEVTLMDDVDPLNLLLSANGDSAPRPAIATGPLDAPTVVAVAKRAFESLGPQGEEILRKKSTRSTLSSFESPLAGDVIVVEANGTATPLDHPDSSECGFSNDGNNDMNLQPPIPGELIVHKKITKVPILDKSIRKKKIMEWLCNNMFHLNELSNLPFNDCELWRLHQHFVSPTIQETNLHCNGESHITTESIDTLNSVAHQYNSVLSEPCAPSQSADLSTVPASEPVMGNLPMLKRKVSYRFLQEAAMIERPENHVQPDMEVTKLIEDMNGHTMQPKSKRARKNRSRISIVPRIKKKLDSYLVSDHYRALGLMRQLAYVEKSLLNGSIYPVGDVGTATHLIGSLASDAEMILVDMM